MKKIVLVLLAVILLVPVLCAPGAARAEEGAKLFRVGEQLLLFEKDGLRVSLEGGIVMLDTAKAFPALADIREESASVALTAVVENSTDRNLYIEYSGSVNGIPLGNGSHPLVSVHILTAGSRNAVYIPFRKDWLNGADVRWLKNCDLTFHVWEKPTNNNSDNVPLYDVPAGEVRFDRAPYTGLSFREGESLVLLDRDGLQISISTVQISKGSVYLLMGGRVVNNTGKTLTVRSMSKVNGWDLGGFRNTPMLSTGKEPTGGFPSGTDTEVIMPISLLNWVPVRAFAELESMELTFEVSELDRNGKETLWFREPTGKIWINREAGTEEEPPRAADAAGSAAGEPAAEDTGFRLMYGLEYGDDKDTVSRKIREGGGSAKDENGALHGEADLLDLPNTSWDYQFTDGGALYCVRNLCILQNKKAADTAELYESARAQLVAYFGEPNGRGPTEERQSVDAQLVEAVSSFMTGPYCEALQHDEWYITDAGPYPLKIDLFYEDSGNREKGNYGIVIEVDIEAKGV